MATVWEIAEPSLISSQAASDLPYSQLTQKFLALRGFKVEAEIKLS